MLIKPFLIVLIVMFTCKNDSLVINSIYSGQLQFSHAWKKYIEKWSSLYRELVLPPAGRLEVLPYVTVGFAWL
jgi:hypothetical protein